MYEHDKLSNSSIKNFLDYGFSAENYDRMIDKRSCDIANKFIEKFEEYYQSIMRG